MPAVSLYAALLAPLFIALSLRTLRMRRRLRIAIGDSGSAEMLRAMRVHANFAEYVPLSLFLLYFAELSGAPALLIHALGVALIVGRLSHAYGVSQTKENGRFRVFGMAMTFTTLGVSSAYLLWLHTAELVA